MRFYDGIFNLLYNYTLVLHYPIIIIMQNFTILHLNQIIHTHTFNICTLIKLHTLTLLIFFSNKILIKYIFV